MQEHLGLWAILHHQKQRIKAVEKNYVMQAIFCRKQPGEINKGNFKLKNKFSD